MSHEAFFPSVFFVKFVWTVCLFQMEFDAQMDEVKKGTRLCSLPDISIPSVPTAPALPVRARLLHGLIIIIIMMFRLCCRNVLASLWISLAVFICTVSVIMKDCVFCIITWDISGFQADLSDACALYMFHIYNTWILWWNTFPHIISTFHPCLFVWLFLNVEKFKHFNKCELFSDNEHYATHNLLLKDRSFPYEDHGPSLP